MQFKNRTKDFLNNNKKHWLVSVTSNNRFYAFYMSSVGCSENCTYCFEFFFASYLDLIIVCLLIILGATGKHNIT